jgi:hypothetical protein
MTFFLTEATFFDTFTVRFAVGFRRFLTVFLARLADFIPVPSFLLI